MNSQIEELKKEIAYQSDIKTIMLSIASLVGALATLSERNELNSKDSVSKLVAIGDSLNVLKAFLLERGSDKLDGLLEKVFTANSLNKDDQQKVISIIESLILSGDKFDSKIRNIILNTSNEKVDKVYKWVTETGEDKWEGKTKTIITKIIQDEIKDTLRWFMIKLIMFLVGTVAVLELLLKLVFKL